MSRCVSLLDITSWCVLIVRVLCSQNLDVYVAMLLVRAVKGVYAFGLTACFARLFAALPPWCPVGPPALCAF